MVPISPNASLNDKIFSFLLQLQQNAAQLRMNHWQTESFAEHKATDKFIDVIYEFVDALAESSIGEFGRPKIQTTNMSVSDMSITSTKWVLGTIEEGIRNLIAELKITEHEGLLALAGDFEAETKKMVYLITLG